MSEKPGLLVGILIGFILGCLFGLICGKSCRSDAKQRRHFSRPISDPQVQSETPDLLDQAQWLPNTNQPGRYVYREIQVNKPCKYCQSNELWFFPENNRLCWSLKEAYCLERRKRETDWTRCNYEHFEDISQKKSSFVNLVKTLESAKRELCICLHLINSIQLSRVICDIKNRGVGVRIITDRSRGAEKESQIMMLARRGIPIRENIKELDRDGRSKAGLMHHKFVVIDKEILIIGSYNWSFTATNSNYESILKTNQPRLVKECQEKFDDMWNSESKFSQVNPNNDSNNAVVVNFSK